MGKEIKTEIVVSLTNINCNKHDIVTLTVEVEYGEILGALSVTQMIQNDINLQYAIKQNEEFTDLGYYRYEKLVNGKDGVSKLTFKGVVERHDSGYAKLDALTELQAKERPNGLFRLLVQTEVEIEEEQESFSAVNDDDFDSFEEVEEFQEDTWAEVEENDPWDEWAEVE